MATLEHLTINEDAGTGCPSFALPTLREAPIQGVSHSPQEVRMQHEDQVAIAASLSPAAMLDALVRAGVLTREERKLCDGFAWTSVAPDGTVTSGGRPQTRQRRYVTEWTADA